MLPDGVGDRRGVVQIRLHQRSPAHELTVPGRQIVQHDGRKPARASDLQVCAPTYPAPPATRTACVIDRFPPVCRYGAISEAPTNQILGRQVIGSPDGVPTLSVKLQSAPSAGRFGSARLDESDSSETGACQFKLLGESAGGVRRCPRYRVRRAAYGRRWRCCRITGGTLASAIPWPVSC